MDQKHMHASQRWAEALSRWAIPQHILDAAPESPWACPPPLFAYRVQGQDSPSSRLALEALPAGGEVLDVGAGGGAASLPLAGRCSSITGVDQSRAMLDEFAAAADAAGVRHMEVLGLWPDVAARTPAADVVVCHNVFYNVPDLGPFASALNDHARKRVVVELTTHHPIHDLNPLWLHFHGIQYPDEPTADDALAVLEETGLRPSMQRWSRPPRYRDRDHKDVVAFVRRRLCLPASRDPEVDRLLGSEPFTKPRPVATIYWDISPAATET